MKMTRLEKRFVNASRHGKRNLGILQQLFTHFDTGTLRKVLEIGCGAGTVAAHLSEIHGMQVTATDADPEQVHLAKSHYPEHENLRLLKADATDLPFEDAEFDMVLSLNVFHHIGDWGRVLSEVNRVLKPKGYFVFHDLAYSKLAVTILRPLVRNYGLYTIGDIIEGSKACGLEIVYRREPSRMVFAEHSLVFHKE